PAQPPGQPPASPGTQGPPTIEQVARGEGELRRGDRGPAVLELQRKLNRAGYPVVEDGVFGQETENAVKQFQRDNYLADSGRVGKTTWERLLAAPPVETGSAAPGTQAFPVNVPYQGPAGGQLFGASRDGGSRRHAGLDLTPPINIQGQSSSFPIFAWKAGVVDQSTGRANFGIVRIRHDDGMMSRYLHNTDTVVSTNTRVNAGQRIALMGGRGGSSNSDYVPHLHIEIYNSSGTAIDPKPILLDGSNNPRGGLIVYSHSQYGRPRSTYQA
ncbi:MAG TPA: peptidoglycan-binding protein, partial [Candidatus Nanopelagicales bacterium]|nr:peptidoglycan-binding protein [Candidatus Nanopelagicales bacterium]